MLTRAPHRQTNNCGALTLSTALQARCKEVQAAIKRETGHEREVKAALEEVKSRVATAKHAHATVIVEAEVAEQALRDEIVSLQACLRSSGGGSGHVHRPPAHHLHTTPRLHEMLPASGNRLCRGTQRG